MRKRYVRVVGGWSGIVFYGFLVYSVKVVGIIIIMIIIFFY